MRIPETDFSRTSTGGGSWYFYNPSTLSYGYSQFINKWGRRELEDNWRLSRKQMISNDGFSILENTSSDSTDVSINDEEVPQTSPRTREHYLKNVPLTPELLKKSDEKIIEALYTVGVLYKERLNDFDNAYLIFSDLIKRYPENPYILQSYYNLYKLSIELNRNTEKEYFKSRILNQFPASNYAKIVADPNYFIRMQQQQGESEKYYAEVYETFKNEQYFLVVDMCDKALANFNDTILLPKFDYLKTLSLGRIGTLDVLIQNLQRIISTYPNSEITPVAQQVLISLRPEELTDDVIEIEDINTIYNYSTETFHNFILIVKAGSVNLDALKVRISDFNQKHSRTRRFAISSFELSDEYHLITVSRFNNGTEALSYLKAVENDNYVLSIFNTEEEYKQFVISNDNYLLFYKNKNIDDYLRFYERYYNN